MSADRSLQGAEWFVRNSAQSRIRATWVTGISIMFMDPPGLRTPLLWGGGGTNKSWTVYTFTLNIQWRQPHFSTDETMYWNPQSMGLCCLYLAGKEWLGRSISNSNCGHLDTAAISTPTLTPIHTRLHKQPQQLATINILTLFVK